MRQVPVTSAMRSASALNGMVRAPKAQSSSPHKRRGRPWPVGSGFGMPVVPHAKAHPIFQMLRDVRIERGISLQKLGKMTGYWWETIGHWERGEYPPSTLKFLDWCQALGVRVSVARETE